jgi:hypothetical protein
VVDRLFWKDIMLHQVAPQFTTAWSVVFVLKMAPSVGRRRPWLVTMPDYAEFFRFVSVLTGGSDTSPRLVLKVLDVWVCILYSSVVPWADATRERRGISIGSECLESCAEESS